MKHIGNIVNAEVMARNVLWEDKYYMKCKKKKKHSAPDARTQNELDIAFALLCLILLDDDD